MLLSIHSSIPTFKTLTFGRGLNILQADRTSTSTDRQTRNSAGKTSFVEIVHFLLGSELRQGGLLSKTVFTGHSFTGELLLRDVLVRVTRHVDTADMIMMSPDAAASLGVSLVYDDEDLPPYLPISIWKDVLGNRWLGLPARREGSDFEERFSPTFRSTIAYFARRTVSGGFRSPVQHALAQKPGDWQTNLAYLIGLDWKLSRARQELRERSQELVKLRKAIKEGELGQLFGTAAEIRPELVRVDESIARLRRRVEEFTVHEQYTELASRVATLRNEMTATTREIARLDESIDYLSRSIEEEKPPAYADLEALYASASIELPDIVLRRFEEADRFRRSVTRNRALYLQGQVEEARNDREELVAALKAMDDEKSAILKALSGKGAFEDLTALQDELATERMRRDRLDVKLQNANALENDRVAQRRDEAALVVRLQGSLIEHEATIRDAVAKVDHAIAALYDDRKGNLIIEAGKGWFSYSVQIDGGGNHGGIDMMKIFCFDMMLFEVMADRIGGPRFLVHDSHLFDGVDARQVHGALAYGAEAAERVGGQYIVTMNSDVLDAARAYGARDIDAALLPRSLDDTETGGLFGFRFD